jgi:tRNA G10  N-methylase Trm11
MPTYFAIFGKTPALSAAELFSLCSQPGKTVRAERVHEIGMIWESETTRDASFWDTLGGSIKAGTIIKKYPIDATKADICTALVADLGERVPAGRILFGISLYPLDVSGTKQEKVLAGLGAEVKQTLVEEGRSARHVTSNDQTLSAVTITKNHLLGPGVEYCIFLDGGMIALGVTSWVQPYEDFSAREFGRPRANSRSGMLPVKVARMILHLAGIPASATVLDPFCGSGTVATEALALGFAHVVATDLEERAVAETKENSAWIRGHVRVAGEITVAQTPVERLSEVIPPASIDAVITEPFLGPPLRGSETREFVEKSAENLEKLYLAAFEQFALVLKKGSPVIFILPFFVRPNVGAFKKLLPELQKMGFVTEPPLPERFQKTKGFTLSPRGGLLYGREDQKVLREILCFRYQPSKVSTRAS